MTKNPVCKMEVDEKTAAATSTYRGQTSHFCSAGCKKKFAQDPENTRLNGCAERRQQEAQRARH